MIDLWAKNSIPRARRMEYNIFNRLSLHWRLNSFCFFRIFVVWLENWSNQLIHIFCSPVTKLSSGVDPFFVHQYWSIKLSSDVEHLIYGLLGESQLTSTDVYGIAPIISESHCITWSNSKQLNWGQLTSSTQHSHCVESHFGDLRRSDNNSFD